PPSHTLIIHHYHHRVGYAIPPHSSLVADNDSNSSQSACTPRQEAASIASTIFSSRVSLFWLDHRHPHVSSSHTLHRLCDGIGAIRRPLVGQYGFFGNGHLDTNLWAL